MIDMLSESDSLPGVYTAYLYSYDEFALVIDVENQAVGCDK